MSARDTARPLPFTSAARGVFDLALEGMLWSRRSLLMALLLGAPVAFGIFYQAVLAARIPPRVTGFDLYGYVVVLYYIGNVLPLAALFYATSLVADEVEGKTITYLLTRPIPRPALLAGKFASYLATTLALTLPSTVIAFFLLLTGRGAAALGAAVPDLLRDMGVLGLALVVYGALFTLLGVLLRRPLIPGLLFIYVWELLSNLPGYMPRLTLTTYLKSLVAHRPAQEGLGALFGQTLPAGLSLGVLGGATLLFLAGAFWIFSTREYVLEQ